MNDDNEDELPPELDLLDALDRAIAAAIRAQGCGRLLVDWIVCWAAIDAEDDSLTSYGHTAADTYRTYRALGLLDLTRSRLLREGWNIDEDDDDDGR